MMCPRFFKVLPPSVSASSQTTCSAPSRSTVAAILRTWYSKGAQHGLPEIKTRQSEAIWVPETHNEVMELPQVTSKPGCGVGAGSPIGSPHKWWYIRPTQRFCAATMKLVEPHGTLDAPVGQSMRRSKLVACGEAAPVATPSPHAPCHVTI